VVERLVQPDHPSEADVTASHTVASDTRPGWRSRTARGHPAAKFSDLQEVMHFTEAKRTTPSQIVANNKPPERPLLPSGGAQIWILRLNLNEDKDNR
jgi:hypothetical protein